MTQYSTAAAHAYFKQLCVLFPQCRNATAEQFIEFLKGEGFEFVDDCTDGTVEGGARK